MKNIINTIRKYQRLTVLALLLFVLAAFKKGDCTSDAMHGEAIDRLEKYTLIQDFPVYLKKKGKKDPLEYKKIMVTLNRGVRYKFYTIRNKEFDGLPILTLYNNEKQEFMLGSTYNNYLKKFYNELEFESKSSGTYCLSVSFQDGIEGCALGVFASLIKE